jgi:hypothetical protein
MEYLIFSESDFLSIAFQIRKCRISIVAYSYLVALVTAVIVLSFKMGAPHVGQDSEGQL